MGGSGARTSLSGRPRPSAYDGQVVADLAARQELGELFELEAERHPGVAELDRAAQGAARPAPDPDLDLPRQAGRLDDESLEVVVRPVVLGHPLAPCGTDGPDGVVGSFPPTVERVPEDLELGLERPDAHAGDDASAAQDVKGSQPLHQLERMVVGQDGHVGEEADPRGLGGEVAERREGVEVAAAAHRGRRGRDRDVLRARHPVEAATSPPLAPPGPRRRLPPSPPTPEGRSAGSCAALASRCRGRAPYVQRIRVPAACRSTVLELWHQSAGLAHPGM